jgi:hypothetical protein
VNDAARLALLCTLAALAGVLYLYASDAEAASAPDEPAPPESDAFGLADAVNSLVETVGLRAPRGERNNNPGNIRLSGTQWRGQVAGIDPAFVTFATPQDGIRAIAVILKNYHARYGINTVAGIINRWAPPVENDTAAYAGAVARALGVGVNDPLDMTDAGTLQLLIESIIRHENGRQSYALADIAAGVAMA